MQLLFADPVSIIFFVVFLLYYSLVVIISFIPHNTKFIVHHYHIGFAILVGAIIPLVFLRAVGQNDFIVGMFWGSIILGFFSVVIDFTDLKNYVQRLNEWFKRK